MGGLRKYMPLTYWTFLASTLAIVGLPAHERVLLEGRDPLPRVRVDHTVNPFAERLMPEALRFFGRRTGSARPSTSSACSRRR